MGHRREIFKPRTKKNRISTQFNEKLKQTKIDEAVQIGLAHYSTKSTSDAFATSLIATAEALILANEANWSKPLETFVLRGISRAERKTETRLNKFRKKTIYHLVLDSLKKERRDLELVF